MADVQKPVTPRNATPRQNTPRSSAKAAEAELDPKIVQLVWTSLKDRIYQRSHNLRQTYRELDAKGSGMIPIAEFVEEMGRAYQLSPVERQCLALLLREADFRRDGLIDFREFVEMLKVHHKAREGETGAELSLLERRRFDRCTMDKKMQHVVIRDENRPIKIVGSMPTNELGAMTIDTPYGVLGDSERMDAVIASFLTIKYEKLRTIFNQFNTLKHGRVTHQEFRTGMKELDPYVFDDEIDNLLGILDRKKKGYVVVDEFAAGLGREYLKKKAHRSQAHESPFQWPIVEKKKPATADKEHSPRIPKPPLPTARTTRAAELRNHDAHDKLNEIYRREEGMHSARVTAGTTSGQHAINTQPKPPKSLAASSPRKESSTQQKESSTTPRLPQIHSARGNSAQ